MLPDTFAGIDVLDQRFAVALDRDGLQLIDVVVVTIIEIIVAGRDSVTDRGYRGLRRGGFDAVVRAGMLTQYNYLVAGPYSRSTFSSANSWAAMRPLMKGCYGR